MERSIAVIGSGGKTTAMELLARQSGARSVLVTTTTHIYPMEPPQCRVCLKSPDGFELYTALQEPGIVCAGTIVREGKLGMLPPPVLDRGLLAKPLLIYEADGSRHLPLKLHRPGEPVILPGTDRCLVVAGLSAPGKPVESVVHRYERRWEQDSHRIVGVEEFLACVEETAVASGLPRERVRVFLNQADVLEDLEPARTMVRWLQQHGLEARFGSLRQAPALYDWVAAD